MTDREIITVLQREAVHRTPVELAELLGEIYGKLEQGILVMMFTRAFPGIPLRTMLDLCEWSRVSPGSISDDEFNRRLSSWIGPQRAKR
jgi:hypothetical protein